MEENNKINSEAVKTKENDCKLSEKELGTVAGGGNSGLGKRLGDTAIAQPQRA